MEKISALIDKLQELKNSDAGLQTISYYTQLLQAEILHQRNLQRQQETKAHRHVAVILPAHTPAPAAGNTAAVSQDMATQNGYAQHKVPVKPRPQEQAATLFDQPQQETPVHKPDHLHTAQPSHHDHNIRTAQQPQAPASRHDHEPPPPPAEVPKTDQPQNKPAADAPTGIRKELNELIAKSTPSLNDALRSNGKVELADRLGGMGVKNLNEAIGINDKFQFIQELFRSDKAMYERSIKTINESTSLPEAEYWIERELKIKLGWEESDPLVKQFYTLVRKRFS